MKYDLSSLYMDFMQDKASAELRDLFWSQPIPATAVKIAEPMLMREDVSDALCDYESCVEEFGFIAGFQLAVSLLSSGLGVSAPKVEVQA